MTADAERPASRSGAMLARPPTIDLVLLAVAVLAVSTSAPLIREAALPAIAVAFWRTAAGAAVLAPALTGRHQRARLADLSRSDRRISMFAGVLLAAHFATWIPSLSFTSVASAVALVATQPVWAALIARLRGERVPRAVWVGIALALGGTIALAGVDVSISTRALFGDGLALSGGALAAAYVTAGADARQNVTTTIYAVICYATAAVVLLVGCIAGGQALGGYPLRAWLCIAGIVVGPQLLGHTVVNRVLRTTSPTVVSVSILFEVVGAAALAAWWFGERPPAGAVPAAVLILAGVVVVIRAGAPATPLAEELPG
jgi:drug/metabolite transporter (DMT)-like permease